MLYIEHCMILVLVLLVIVVLVIFICARCTTKTYLIHGIVVNVISDYENHEEAALVVLEANKRLLRLLDHLRKKYYIGATDEECGASCAKMRSANERKNAVVAHLLRKFDFQAIYENRPKVGSGDRVAYSLDKGRVIKLCLRSNKNTRTIVDVNTLMFVILHEAAHVALFDAWGHPAQFWEIFKYLLTEAVAIGIYKPVDYMAKPADYCGFIIDHNPYFDANIRSW